MTDRDVVCVVDQSAEDREVFNRILCRSGYLVRDYEDSAGFLDELATLRAGCVIVDVLLPDTDVPAFVSDLARTRPDIPCLVAAQSGDVPLATETMKAGAVDFVEKPMDAESLLQTVRHAIKNRPPATEGAAPARSCLIERLTPRERDVLDLLVQGYQSKMIAYELGISQRTVDVYRARLRRRLKANSFAELLRVAIEEQLAATRRTDAPSERRR
jgi:two-component system response regulator FixJ